MLNTELVYLESLICLNVSYFWNLVLYTFKLLTLVITIQL